MEGGQWPTDPMRRFLCFIAFLSTAGALAFDLPPGKPLVQNWSMADYGGQVTNWAIGQAPDGRMLVGNGHYLLTFDGAQWRQIETPQTDRVRVMAIDQAGRVWVGMPNEFGYYQADDTGALIYTSLSATLSESQQGFGETRGVHLIEGRAYFHTLDAIFQWDGQSLMSFPKRDRIFRLSLVHQDRLMVLIGRELHDLTDFPDQDQPLLPEPGWQQPEGTRLTFLQSFPDGRILMGTLDQGLFWLSRSDPVQAARFAEMEDAWPFRALPLADGSYVLGTRNKGIMQISADGRLIDHFSDRNGLNSNVISAMALDSEGGLWLAQEGAIARVDSFNGLRYYDSDLGVSQAEALVDHQGELLVAGSHGVGTLKGNGSDGAELLSMNAPLLEAFGILDDGDAVLVSGSEGVHRMLFDLDAGETTESERLVADTYGYGLTRSRHYPVIYAELESGMGLLIRRGSSWSTVQRVDGIDQRVNWIAEDEERLVWAGTGAGVFYQLRWNEAALQIENLPPDTPWQPLELIATLGADQGVPPGSAWPFNVGERVVLGTTEGGYRLADGAPLRIEPDPDFDNDSVGQPRNVNRLFAVDDRRVIGSIGDGGALWLGSIDDRARIRWQRRLLPQMQPGQNWFFKVLRGQLWFGRHPGLYRLDLNALELDVPLQGQVAVQRAGFPDQDRWLRGGPLAKSEIEIDREQPALRFEYALNSYLLPDQTEYRVRLDGLESTWTRWSDETMRDYPQLPAGRFEFQVQARDVTGRVLDSVPLSLRVLPRWYEHPLAFLAYGLAALLLMMLAVQFGQRRRQKRMLADQRVLERTVAERTAEARASAREAQRMSDARAEFFANVSHELRTPLTLTRAPLDELAREASLSEEGKQHLTLARRNTEVMQSLIGQVLDLQKLDVGEMPMRPVRSDLALAVNRVAKRFQLHAQSQSVGLEVQGTQAVHPAVFDPRHVDTMLNNLLSNALKFTPSGGQVVVALSQTEAEHIITVSDSGPGIAAEDQSEIFERYRQGTVAAPGGGGTGIGLALVRELIELHEGRVALDSQPGRGARFSLHLPTTLQSLGEASNWEGDSPDSQPDRPVSAEGNPSDLGPEAPQLLLVDDNAELREFLRLRLGRNFRILEAENGVRGLEQAREYVPDLIVTDGMMPELDGLGLTRAIKADPELDFIPVLMLTARGESDAIVQGLAAGADDYLAKPFDGAELAARINGLIASRRRLKARLQAEIDADGGAIDIASEFQQAAARVVDASLSDPSFSVRDWASLMHMDRTTLFRKFKQETGQSPDEFLREARMQRAADLLKRRAGNVAEVAEAVGFASVSSFSRRFRERFGQTPASFSRES